MVSKVLLALCVVVVVATAVPFAGPSASAAGANPWIPPWVAAPGAGQPGAAAGVNPWIPPWVAAPGAGQPGAAAGVSPWIPPWVAAPGAGRPGAAGGANSWTPPWVATAPWFPRWTPCTTVGSSCQDCTTKLVCTKVGGLQRTCTDPTLPYCNLGECSATPSAECAVAVNA